MLYEECGLGHECPKPQARVRHRFGSCGWAGLCHEASLAGGDVNAATLPASLRSSFGKSIGIIVSRHQSLDDRVETRPISLTK
jgi:hypothetical protein